jgi:hypothetical protein
LDRPSCRSPSHELLVLRRRPLLLLQVGTTVTLLYHDIGMHAGHKYVGSRDAAGSMDGCRPALCRDGLISFGPAEAWY